jgi:hypothetical protein
MIGDALDMAGIALALVALLLTLAGYLRIKQEARFLDVLLYVAIPAGVPATLFVAVAFKAWWVVNATPPGAWVDRALVILLVLSFLALAPAALLASIYLLQKDLTRLARPPGAPNATPSGAPATPAAAP